MEPIRQGVPFVLYLHTLDDLEEKLREEVRRREGLDEDSLRKKVFIN